MAIPLRALAATAVLGLLAACQSAAEHRAAFEAEIRASCTQQGFAADSDAFRLCLLLETTNVRLRNIERRLDILELDLRRDGVIGPGCRSCS